MTKPNDPRRKEWDKKYREARKDEINSKARARSREAELRRDPVKRAASRKRYYEKTKAKWIARIKEMRKRDVGWANNGLPTWVLDRIEQIVKNDSVSK